ncbi:DUF2334 domain-containing protein [Clostridium sp. JN-1]|uniref:DUF2334 domain-containing protein n=1 Tax=Clostridium sp. JN-1 TaxID=2483110 RepID=UPI0016808E74|nr:DUF2334 domain-containing protein [Clostridium sp. JN-1]
MKKSKNIILSLFAVILTLSVIFFAFHKKAAYSKNSVRIDDFSDFSGLNMEKANIKIRFENKDLSLKLPVYVEKNRYYIPLNEVMQKTNGKCSIDNNKIYLKNFKCSGQIDLNKNTFLNDGESIKLNKNIIIKDNIAYMNLFDFSRIFDLKVFWDIPQMTLSLYNNKEVLHTEKNIQSDKMSFLRLEDITAGGIYSSPEALQKLRIISDYLYEKNVPFHAAWVPRYVNPSRGIDNDVSKKNSIYNADFVYTLDYFISRGGIIGAHGYTHQYGNAESVDGIEFSMGSRDSIPKDSTYAQERVNDAVKVFNDLNIKCSFFEVPHYAILPRQMDVIEKNFDYIYEPYSRDGGVTEYKYVVRINNNGRNVLYIPTPLNYVDGKKDCNNMINKIRNLNDKNIASFFYHPYIEFEDITLKKDSNGYIDYNYSEHSVLHSVIDEIYKKGYKFYKIYDIK